MSKPTPDAAISQQVGLALQRARLSCGITQAELGQALGVKRVTVSRWERGERSLDITTLLTIARLLHIHPADLLPGTGPNVYARANPMPQQSIAESPPAKAPPDDPDVAQAVALLYQHPELAASVTELIETMLEA